MPFVSAVSHFVIAWLLAVATNWISLFAWRRAAAAHWTERARLLWPVRVTAGLNVFGFTLLLLQLHWLISPHTMKWYISDGLGSFVGAALGCYHLQKAIFPQLTFSNWWKQLVLGWGIRFGLIAPYIAALVLMPEKFGLKMVLIAGGYLALHFALQWGLLLKILQRMGALKPAGLRLQKIVDAFAEQMKVKVRATWQIGGLTANAFAIITIRELIFTNPLLKVCTDEEVASICVHELAHLTESKMVLAGRLLTSLIFFPFIFIHLLLYQWSLAGLFFPYLWVIIVSISTRHLSRRMEKRADQMAAQEQTNASIYAGALEKLYRENRIPAVMPGNRHAHPHLYDRMLAAGITPDFPRPVPPKKLTPWGWVYLVLLIIISSYDASLVFS